MNQEWYKNPTILVVGGVALFAAFVLLRSQNSTATPNTTTTTNAQQTSTDPSTSQPLGNYQTYLDGNGVAHQIAVGPYYYYSGYQAIPGSSQLNQPQPINNSLV